MTEITQFKLNIPNDLKRWLDREAARNMRSVSKEIIFHLQEKMQAATGAKFGDQTPAAALNPTALEGGENINNG